MKNLMEGGNFELITGPMFSGKTSALIQKFQEAEKQNIKAKCFKPVVDNRYAIDKIVSHDGNKIEAAVIENVSDLLKIASEYKLVFIDEIQFLDPTITKIIEDLKKKSIDVVASGLEYDYMGNYFGEMKQLVSQANSISRLTGTCMVCNAIGTHTFRKDKQNFDTVLVGSHDLYEIRCEACYKKGNNVWAK